MCDVIYGRSPYDFESFYYIFKSILKMISFDEDVIQTQSSLFF